MKKHSRNKPITSQVEIVVTEDSKQETIFFPLSKNQIEITLDSSAIEKLSDICNPDNITLRYLKIIGIPTLQRLSLHDIKINNLNNIYLSPNEITILDIRNTGLNSLDGIQKFQKLQILYLPECNLNGEAHHCKYNYALFKIQGEPIFYNNDLRSKEFNILDIPDDQEIDYVNDFQQIIINNKILTIMIAEAISIDKIPLLVTANKLTSIINTSILSQMVDRLDGTGTDLNIRKIKTIYNKLNIESQITIADEKYLNQLFCDLKINERDYVWSATSLKIIQRYLDTNNPANMKVIQAIQHSKNLEHFDQILTNYWKHKYQLENYSLDLTKLIFDFIIGSNYTSNLIIDEIFSNLANSLHNDQSIEHYE